MSYVTWQNWMSVGVPLVDSDHQVLVSLINQVHSCMESGQEYTVLASVLHSLADYTDYHFSEEEKLIRQWALHGTHGAPHLQAHAN